MNVSLNGARSQARLDWDALEKSNARASSLPRKVFGLAVVLFAVYLVWSHFAS